MVWKELGKSCAITFLHWTFLFSLIWIIFHSQVIMWCDLEEGTETVCRILPKGTRSACKKKKADSKGIEVQQSCTSLTKKHWLVAEKICWKWSQYYQESYIQCVLFSPPFKKWLRLHDCLLLLRTGGCSALRKNGPEVLNHVWKGRMVLWQEDWIQETWLQIPLGYKSTLGLALKALWDTGSPFTFICNNGL